MRAATQTLPDRRHALKITLQMPVEQMTTGLRLALKYGVNLKGSPRVAPREGTVIGVGTEENSRSETFFNIWGTPTNVYVKQISE